MLAHRLVAAEAAGAEGLRLAQLDHRPHLRLQGRELASGRSPGSCPRIAVVKPGSLDARGAQA